MPFYISRDNITLFSIHLPFLGGLNLELPLFFITSYCYLDCGITNSINWLDGIDGLASGYSLICTFGLFSIMFMENNPQGIIFFSILFGSIIGFLIRNFKPAYYIMGDCGSNFLGYILSTGSIVFFEQSNGTNQIPFYYLLLFSLPLGDMIYVICKDFK